MGFPDWQLKAEYEVELDGRVVACFKPHEKLDGFPYTVVDSHNGHVDYQVPWFGIGALIQLDGMVVKVTKIVHAELKKDDYLRIDWGPPPQDLYDIECELREKSHPDNPIRLGRVVVEKVHGFGIG